MFSIVTPSRSFEKGWQQYEAGARRMHPAFWELFFGSARSRAVMTTRD